MVQLRHEVIGLDAAILSSPRIWEASGHLANFTDPLVDCRNCNERWRADHLEPDSVDGKVRCPNCGSSDLTEARAFNLMFKTYVGPLEDDSNVAYLRPETAQGHFVNFLNVLQTSRKRPPFGIAQIGIGEIGGAARLSIIPVVRPAPATMHRSWTLIGLERSATRYVDCLPLPLGT